MKKFIRNVATILVLICMFATNAMPVNASCNSKPKTLPDSYGTLTANVWHSTDKTKSGNTYQWDYQVSAVYSGTKTVEEIKTTWYGSASLRNGASFNIGVSGDGVSAGVSSSWSTITTASAYWSNTNGTKTSSYRSNMVIGPCCDYRDNTVTLSNTAYLKIKGDRRTWTITASV